MNIKFFIIIFNFIVLLLLSSCIEKNNIKHTCKEYTYYIFEQFNNSIYNLNEIALYERNQECYIVDFIAKKKEYYVLPDSLGGNKLRGFASMIFYIEDGKIEHFYIDELSLTCENEPYFLGHSNFKKYILFFKQYKDSIRITLRDDKENNEHCLVQQEQIEISINQSFPNSSEAIKK